MRFDQRVVSQTPLEELWNDQGVVSSTELRDLNALEIAELLRNGKVQFVVANIGDRLKWIKIDKCHDFWKTEVKNHLADPQAVKCLEDFPESYCYFASEWDSRENPIVLLVMAH